MFLKLLAILFTPRYIEDGYKAHPLHVIYSIFIMAVGVATITRDNWGLFGTLTLIIGTGLGFTVVISILWDKSIKYWETINEHVNLMERVKNPELWQALGYKNSPSQITLIETKQEDKESGYQMRFKNIPVSPAVMNQLANKVLLSNDTSITLELLASQVSNPRKLYKWLRDNQFIKANLIKNGKEVPTQGYALNHKGIELVNQYASDTIRAEIEKRRKDENGRQTRGNESTDKF